MAAGWGALASGGNKDLFLSPLRAGVPLDPFPNCNGPVSGRDPVKMY